MTSPLPLERHTARVRADDWPRAGTTPSRDPSLGQGSAQAREQETAQAQGLAQGRLREIPEDFVVDELSRLPDSAGPGSGDYVHLRIRKRNLTTPWLVGALARHFGAPQREVGYAGLKDRRAITSQWFSVRAPWGMSVAPWFEPGTAILAVRHAEAGLRPGDLDGNAFRLRVRDVDEPSVLEAALQRLLAAPFVPNYFGVQRFGNDAGNLVAVWDWFAGRRVPDTRFERGIFLSAARSLLFNLALADRVRDGTWSMSLPGEARVHGRPAGPLWGRGRTLVQRDALARCQETWRDAGPARMLVEREGLRQDLRSWALAVSGLDWTWFGRDVVVTFSLPAGGYATTVLRELVRGAAAAAEEEDDGAAAGDVASAPSRLPRVSGGAR